MKEERFAGRLGGGRGKERGRGLVVQVPPMVGSRSLLPNSGVHVHIHGARSACSVCSGCVCLRVFLCTVFCSSDAQMPRPFDVPVCFRVRTRSDNVLFTVPHPQALSSETHCLISENTLNGKNPKQRPFSSQLHFFPKASLRVTAGGRGHGPPGRRVQRDRRAPRAAQGAGPLTQESSLRAG